MVQLSAESDVLTILTARSQFAPLAARIRVVLLTDRDATSWRQPASPDTLVGSCA